MLNVSRLYTDPRIKRRKRGARKRKVRKLTRGSAIVRRLA